MLDLLTLEQKQPYLRSERTVPTRAASSSVSTASCTAASSAVIGSAAKPARAAHTTTCSLATEFLTLRVCTTTLRAAGAVVAVHLLTGISAGLPFEYLRDAPLVGACSQRASIEEPWQLPDGWIEKILNEAGIGVLNGFCGKAEGQNILLTVFGRHRGGGVQQRDGDEKNNT